MHTVCFLDILKGMFICLFKVRKFFHCAMHWCNSSLSQKKQSLAWPQWWSFENRFLLRAQTRRQKLGIIFEKKVFQEIKLPYALHHKPWLVYFLSHFSLRLILQYKLQWKEQLVLNLKNFPHGFDKSADLLSKRQNRKEDFFKLFVPLKKYKQFMY